MHEMCRPTHLPPRGVCQAGRGWMGDLGVHGCNDLFILVFADDNDNDKGNGR